MSETIYLGSGKTVTGQYGEFFNVTLNLDKIKQNPNVVEDYKGWNDPSKIKAKTETQSADDSGLPF